MSEKLPAREARVQRYGYAALASASALGALAAFSVPGRVLGVEVPLIARLGLVVVGALAGAVATHRRSSPFALGASVALVLGVAPAGAIDPGFVGYVVGFGFGALLLAWNELVHMTQRYDRAHKLVEEESASAEGLDRVTDEALKTLGTRAALAFGVAFGVVLVALGLAAFGPQRFREAVETASPLGVAVLAVATFAALSMFVLSRGAKLRAEPSPASQEVAPDVPE